MKKILFLLVGVLTFSASYSDCDNAVRRRGYSIQQTFSKSPDSGGELSKLNPIKSTLKEHS